MNGIYVMHTWNILGLEGWKGLGLDTDAKWSGVCERWDFFVYFGCFFLYRCCCFSRWQRILRRRTRIWHVHANRLSVVSIYSGDSLSVFTCLNWITYWKLDTSAFLPFSLLLNSPATYHIKLPYLKHSYHIFPLLLITLHLLHWYCLSGLVKKSVEMLMKKGPDDCGKDLGGKIVSFVKSKNTKGCKEGKPSFLFVPRRDLCKRFSLGYGASLQDRKSVV